ncbi:MAG: hypothetical protein ACTS2F_21665 [Thainema sp.]
MKIAKRTSTHLQIRDVPLETWIFGSVFAVLGTYIITSGFIYGTSELAISTAANGFFGGLFLLVGLMILRRGCLLRCDFDKATGTLTMINRGVLRTNCERLRLKDITKVKLEQPLKSITGNSSTNGLVENEVVEVPAPAYRIVLVLDERQQLPLTSRYYENREHQKLLAESIAEFLDVEAEIPPGLGDLLKSFWGGIKSYFQADAE